jgi:hypothetical protein
MSKTTSAELSLINDSELLEALEHFGPGPSRDGFAALEGGLPMHPGVPAIGESFAPPLPVPPAATAANPYDEPIEARPAPAENQIPFVAAALVIAACLTAGAATAAFIFHDQLTQITATLQAIR